MAYDKDREVREAIDAGEQALRSLKTRYDLRTYEAQEDRRCRTVY